MLRGIVLHQEILNEVTRYVVMLMEPQKLCFIGLCGIHTLKLCFELFLFVLYFALFRLLHSPLGCKFFSLFS